MSWSSYPRGAFDAKLRVTWLLAAAMMSPLQQSSLVMRSARLFDAGHPQLRQPH